MTAPDVSTLSYNELVTLRKALDQQIAARRIEELKVLADGFARKIEAAGFTVREAMQALEPYDAADTKSSKRVFGAAVPLYRDPQNPENTWSGRGRPARWLAAYEAAGRSRDEFRIPL